MWLLYLLFTVLVFYAIGGLVGRGIAKLCEAFVWLSRQPDWVVITAAFAAPVVIFGSLILSFHL